MNSALQEFIVKIGFDVNKGVLGDIKKNVQDITSNFKRLNSEASNTSNTLSLTTSKVNLYERSFSSFSNSVSRFLAVGSLSYITKMIANNALAIESMDDLAQSVNLPVGMLQKFQSAAEISGVKLKVLQGSLLQFNKNLSDKSKVDVLGGLGVGLKDVEGKPKNNIDLYRETAFRINQISDANKRAATSQLLLGTTNDKLHRFLLQSNEAILDQINSVSKLGYIIDEKSIGQIRNFNNEWKKTGYIFSCLRDEITTKLSPIFSDILVSFNSWVGKNRGDISNTISDASREIGNLINIFKMLSGVVDKGAQSLGGWGNVISTIGFAKITSKLTGLRSVYSYVIGSILQDLWKWKDGQSSITGRILGDFDKFKIKAEKRILPIAGHHQQIQNDALEVLYSVSRFIKNKWTGSQAKEEIKDNSKQDVIDKTVINPFTYRERYNYEGSIFKDQIQPKFNYNNPNYNNRYNKNNIVNNINITVPSNTNDNLVELIAKKVEDSLNLPNMFDRFMDDTLDSSVASEF